MVRHIPLDVILSWPVANYHNPVTRGRSLLVVNAILIGLVTTAVSLRYYARIRIKRWFGSDDVLITLAFITALCMSITLFVSQHYGWDRHIWDVPFTMFQDALIVAYVAKIEFILASTFTRLSLCFFYRRLNHNSGIAWFEWLVWGGVAFNVLIGLLFLFTAIFQCRPIHAYWTFPPVPNSVCLNEGTWTTGLGAVSVFADLLVTLIPIPLILKLQMPLRQRIGTIVLLCLGIIVTIAGIVRSFYTALTYLRGYDQTWYAYPLWISAAIEVDLGIICACAPALKPLMTGLLQGPRMSTITDRMRSLHSGRSSRRATPNSLKSSDDIEKLELTTNDLTTTQRSIQVTKSTEVVISEAVSRTGSPTPPHSAYQSQLNLGDNKNYYDWDLVTRDGRDPKAVRTISKNF